MADITTPTSATAPAPTAQPLASSPNPPKPATVPPVGSQPNTLSANNPVSLLGPQSITPPSAPPIHSNDAINAALMQAFRPVIPEAINSLLGPAIGQIQGHTLPISFYQPRQAPPVSIRRSS